MNTDRLAEPNNTMKRPQEPEFDMETFVTEIQTSQGNDKKVSIAYEGYLYDSAFRVVKLKVDLKGFSESQFDYLEDDIKEAIALRINKRNVVLETSLEIV